MSISGPKIPQVLEKILQLKEIRQEQLVDPIGLCRCSFSFNLCLKVLGELKRASDLIV